MSYLTDENLQKKYDADIESFTLFHDFFMSIVFKGNKRLMTYVLRIILRKPKLQVIRVTTQDNENNLFGRSARFDILAVDEKGTLYHIEVQNSDEDADEHRAGFYSAIIVEKSTKRGEKKVTYPENYTIFFTRNDYLKDGKPVYHIDRYYANGKKRFKDDIHIVYINGEYKNKTTRIGRLIHDFHCSDPEEMYSKELADEVKKFKTDERGRKKVCEQIRRIEENARREERIKVEKEAEKKIQKTKRESEKKIQKTKRESEKKIQKTKREAEKKIQETRKEAALGLYATGASIEMIALGLKESVEVIRSWVTPAKV